VTGTLITPDGRNVVVRNPDGDFSLHALDGGSERPLPELESEDRPLRFSSDGRFLFVAGSRTELPARVYRLDVASGRRELLRELAPHDAAATTTLSCGSISADGKTLVYLHSTSLGQLYLAEGLR
jgi:Tol biopolymer transport system component